MARLLGAILLAVSSTALAETPAAAPEERTYIFEDGTAYTYTRPTAFGWLARGFTNLAPYTRETFACDNAANLALLVGATAVLVHYDQQIYDSVSGFGRRRGISQDHGGSGTFDLPDNAGNWMYFIGDERVPLGIAGTLATVGWMRDDVRMLSTASQLAEAEVTAGVSSQVLKILTGRQEPVTRTDDGGDWHGPVNPLEYARNFEEYDAMPSRHLASAFAATTVLAENYHEHQVAIWSVGGVLMTALSFEMVNNGVHWAGDFPIGAALGYSVGRLVAKNNRRASAEAADGFTFHLAAADEGLVLEARAKF